MDCSSESAKLLSSVSLHSVCRQLLDLPTMKRYDRSRCFVDTDVSSNEEDEFTVSVCYKGLPPAPRHWQGWLRGEGGLEGGE